jgi:tetratricopeptide (TPR) repeat protein
VLRELRKRAESAEPKRVLLILDNVDQPEMLAPSQTRRLPSADWLHIIATTRLGEADLGKARDRCFVAINELPENDAVDLIEKWQPNGSFPHEAERQAAHELARLLGGFTLAVEAAAVYLGQNAGEVTCAGFKARLEKEGLGGLEEAVGNSAVRVQHDEKRLSVTLQPTLDRLSPPEKLVLTCAALLPADHVVPTWIRPVAAGEFPELGRDAEPGYPDPWKKILGKLISLRFLQSTAELSVQRIHRLVQDLVRQQTEKGRLDTLEESLIAEVKKRGDALWHGWVEQGIRWELEPLAACAQQWMAMESRKLDGADIACLAAWPLYRLARFAESEPLYRRALVIREKALGPDHPDLARPLNGVANLCNTTNRKAEAEPLYRRALAITEKNFGPEHRDVAFPLNGLANLLNETGHPEEAEALFRRALAVSEKNDGADHPNVAFPLNGLSGLLIQAHRYEEAEQLCRRALAIREKSLGPDHPGVARPLNYLANLLNETGRRTEAEPLYRRALAILENNLGPDHPGVGDSLTNLANLYNATGRQAEAEPLYRRALAITEKILGPDHPLVATRLDNLAILLEGAGRTSEAEPLRLRAGNIREKKSGGNA